MGGMAIAGYGASGPEFLEGVSKDVSSSSVKSWGGSGQGSNNPNPNQLRTSDLSGTAAGLLTKDGVTRPTMNQAQAAAQFANLSQAEQSNYLNRLAAGPGGVVARQAFVDQYLGGVTPAGATMGPGSVAAAGVANQGPYSVANQQTTLNEIFANQPVSTGTGLNTGSTISTGGATPTGTDITEIFAEQPLTTALTTLDANGLPAFTGGIPTGTDITEIFAEQPVVVPETKFGDDSGLPSFITNLIATNPALEQIFAEQPLKTALLKVGDLIGLPNFVTEGLGGLDLTTDFTLEELEQLKTAPLTASSNNQQGANTNESNVGTPSAGGAFDIANLAAIRSAVPGTYDPNRRAGSGGQRYFSDVQYAPQGGIAGSQAAANTQAMLLAYQNATNPAYQVRPGNATDRATSMAQRAAGLAGLLPTTVTGTIPTARTTTTATTGDTTTDTTGTTTDTTGATTDTTGATTGTTTGTTGATTGATGATTGATTGTTNTATSPYTYTSESLFQGIDASDGFDETEIGRVAALMNQDYTTANQVGEFFNMSPEDVNRYLGDHNKRTDLISNLGLTEGQQGFTFDQLNMLGASGLENQYLADTFGVDADALQRAIGGASTITGLDSAEGLSLDQQGTIAGLLESGDVSVNNVAKLYGISPDEVQSGYSTYKNTVAQNAVNETIDSGDFDAIAELVTSNKAGIGDIAGRQGVEGMDVVEQLLRGGYETPAEMVERLAAANEGLNEEQLIANLLESGRATPEEISSYYNIPVEAITQRYTELGGTRQFAQGGDINGYYLGGATDGMADQIPATINNMQPAALSDGEFVVPADVVSHLGNGNSDSGAKELYSMMDRIRQDRTGTTKQGRQIDPNKYLA